MILITLRRLIAIILIVLVLPIFIATMVIFRVNSTVLEANFYTDTLAEMDVYNYVYTDAVPFALRDANFDVAEKLPWLNTTNQGVVDSVSRVLPPEWLQANVEASINQIVPYATGASASFDIKVMPDDRVEAAADETKRIIRNADIHVAVMEGIIRPNLVDGATGLLDLPFGVSLTDQKFLDGIKEIAPPDWVNTQVELILDGVTPYVVGKEESFSIALPVQERAPVVVEVLQRWLLNALEDGSARDYIVNENVMPAIQRAIGAQVSLPLGVSLSEAEIGAAAEAAITQQWVEDRINDAADAFGPYLVGQTDTLTLAVPIRAPLEVAASSLATTVDGKYQAILSALPTCTPQQLLGLNLTLTEVPECLPEGVTYEQTKELLGLDVVDQLQGSLIDTLPQNIVLTETVLTDALGDNTILDEARRILGEGYTFTEQKLRTTVLDAGRQGNLDQFDSTREALRDGYTVTDQDLRDQLDPANVDTVNDVRGWIDRGRTLLPLALIVTLSLLVIIGFLAGRNWWSKLGWAGVPLFMAGATVAGSITAGLTYVRSAVGEQVRDINIPAAFLPKVIESTDTLIDTFITPMQVQGFIAAGAGLAMVLTGIFLSKGKGQSTSDSQVSEAPVAVG